MINDLHCNFVHLYSKEAKYLFYSAFRGMRFLKHDITKSDFVAKYNNYDNQK